ncbi:MAG: TonB-dependent receptor [Bacteroidales bacterium]|nr:TonB-dependent receptor [Bacteroidales bacterium]
MRTIYITIVFMLVVLSPALSQIKGIVYEPHENGKKPLFGVNIYWTDTQIGTTSDKNGNFTIKKPNSSNELIFSFIGYRPDTIIVKDPNEKLEIILHNSRFLEEVTIGERKMGSHYKKMETGHVQNITGAELHKAACCNLSESFETNASVDASYSDATTGAKQIKLLGLAGKYVQMMTENIPNLYGISQAYALGYIPGPWMESIQVSKGTSAVLNGYDAITGQINVEYKKPKNADRFYFNQFVSSTGKVENNIDASFIVNPKLSTTIFAHTQFDLLSIDENKDGFADMPQINQYNFFNRWDYFSKNLTMRFGVKYIDESRKSGQLGSIPSDFSDAYTPYKIDIKTNRIEAFYKMGYVFPQRQHQSIAMIANFTGHNQDSYFGPKTFDAQQISGYYNLIWQSAFNANEHHRYNAGLSLKYEDLEQSLNDSLITDLEVVPGAFFQYTGKLFEKFNVIIGGRTDYHNEYGLLITPRLNLRYNITGNVIVRASAGKGYRKANVLAENSFLLASSRMVIIDQDLKLEEAWNYGSNISLYVPIANKDMTVNIEFYRTDFVNQIITDFEDVSKVHFYNLDGQSFSNTFQIETSYEIIKGLDATIAYRYNDVKQTIGNKLVEVPLTSRYKGIATFSYKTPLEKWQFDFTAQFNGGGRIPSTESNPEEFRLLQEFPAYQIYNAQITKFFRHWEMYLGVENLLGFTQKSPIISASDPYSGYFDSSLIWGPVHGRKVFLGVRFSIQKQEK